MVFRLETQAVTTPSVLGMGESGAFGIGTAPGRRRTLALVVLWLIALLPGKMQINPRLLSGRDGGQMGRGSRNLLLVFHQPETRCAGEERLLVRF